MTAVALVAAVGAGCGPAPAAPTATPTPSPTASVSATPSPSGTATPTPSPTALDLTQPGAAQRMVDDLMVAAESTRAIMVTVTSSDASVAVLKAGKVETWAWRDGAIRVVPSDITYVAQRSFAPSEFDFSDVGALFRAAQAVSGSKQGQALQIVDYSGGLVSMSVSTNPESRAVFFNPDGTLLPTLDFNSLWGLQQGYDEVVGPRGTAASLGFGKEVGVYLDGAHDGTSYNRRQRAARTPVLVTPRTEAVPLKPFDPARVKPSVIWGVLQEQRAAGRFSLDGQWSCVVEDREGTGTPQMYFTVGRETFTTDLAGQRL